MNVNIKLLREGAVVPTYGSKSAAGADLYACIPERVCIMPFESVAVPTGIAVEIPEGHAGLIYARSGLACKKDLAPANKVGVIDSDYRGEVIVMLHNHGKITKWVEPGDRIAQFVVTPIVQAVYNVVDELEDTERGIGGFGSTGK